MTIFCVESFGGAVAREELICYHRLNTSAAAADIELRLASAYSRKNQQYRKVTEQAVQGLSDHLSL